MNKRIFQLCVVWFLAISVPLQGVAAMAKTCCWKMELPVSEATMTSAAHADGHDGCHEDAAMSVASDSTPAPAKAPSHAGGHGRCKACAHCAFGVTGAPSYAPVVVLDFNAPTPPAAVPASFHNHISPGLERPPKHLDF